MVRTSACPSRISGTPCAFIDGCSDRSRGDVSFHRGASWKSRSFVRAKCEDGIYGRAKPGTPIKLASGNSGAIYSVPHSGTPSDKVGELMKLAEVSKRVTSMLVLGTDLIYALEDGTIRRLAR